MFTSGGSSRSFTARYPGICEDCQDEFEAGDQIMYNGDDLVHSDPSDCHVVSRSTSAPCQQCFLVHVGECF